MTVKETLQALRDVFPESKVLGKNDLVAEREPQQPLYCTYQRRLRVVADPVCRHHLSVFDPYCWERCETEWTIRRHRPALSAAYRQHKSSMTRRGVHPAEDGGYLRQRSMSW
jgi:hypothetical protein